MGADRSAGAVAILSLVGSTLLLGSCDRSGDFGKPPPRSDTPIVYEPQDSTFTVPLTLNASFLKTRLEQAIPTNLYTLKQHVPACIPSEKVKVFGKKVAVTPKLACDVAIQVTRGPLTLSGGGKNIRLTIPIRAHAKASNIAGVLYETANGAANATVTAKLNVTPGWQLTGNLGLNYSWTTPPTVRFLGHDFTFTDQVDKRLRPIIAQVQSQIPGELAKVNLKSQVASVWRQGFTVINLNGERPAVWMRITPQKAMFGGYSIAGPIVKLSLGVQGTTETFLGPKPAPNPPIPLPDAKPLQVTAGVTRMFVPVVSPYDQVEPVILKALVKRSAQPFNVPKVGPLMARFDKIEAYGTTNDQVTVGLTLSVWPQTNTSAVSSGTVWLVGTVVNAPNTRVLRFKDLHVNGVTDKTVSNLLIRVANHPVIAQQIADALSQNLEKDYTKLQLIIDKAIANVPIGNDFVLSAKIDTMRSGSLKVAGQGLYLPVWAQGQTSMRFKPNR